MIDRTPDQRSALDVGHAGEMRVAAEREPHFGERVVDQPPARGTVEPGRRVLDRPRIEPQLRLGSERAGCLEFEYSCFAAQRLAVGPGSHSSIHEPLEPGSSVEHCSNDVRG
jgi:hypothetical protein